MVADQLIVETWSSYSVKAMDTLVSEFGATVIKDLVDGRCFLIQLPSAKIDAFDTSLADLNQRAQIFRSASPNGYGTVLDTAIPDYDPLFSDDDIFEDGFMWHLDNSDDNDIDAPEGWALQNSAPNTIIAVVDSGVDLDHPDLVDNLWTDSEGYHGYDFVNDDRYPDDLQIPGLPLSNVGHGSQVAGLIAARGNNEIGVTGVVWNTQIMAVATNWTPDDPERKEEFTTDDFIILGLNYALDSGANIVNCSWSDGSDIFDTVLDKARDLDVVVVTSAGNEQKDIVAAERPYPQTRLPDYPNMLVVGASDRTDGVLVLDNGTGTNFSATRVSVAAPGAPTLWTTNRVGGYTGSFGKTSGATPIVSGIAALVRERFNCSAEETVQRIVNSVDLVDAWRDKCIGEGRVNLQRSLSLFSDVPTDKSDFSNPGWRESPWFGWIWDCELGWYYHLELGWLHTTAIDQNSIWLFHFDMREWIYTNKSTYPWFYRSIDDTWLVYTVGTTEPQVFQDSSDGSFEYYYQ